MQMPFSNRQAPSASAPDFVAQLSPEKRSVPGRFAAIWNALREADAERGRHGKGKSGRLAAAGLDQRPFAHPYFWAAFVYTGY